MLKRKAPTSQLPCWEGVNEHGKCRTNPQTEKNRGMVLFVLFPITSTTLYSTRQAQMEAGIICVFMLPFFFPQKVFIFYYCSSSHTWKNAQNEIWICTSKTPQQPELILPCERKERCCHTQQSKNNSIHEELVPAFNCILKCLASQSLLVTAQQKHVL